MILWFVHVEGLLGHIVPHCAHEGQGLHGMVWDTGCLEVPALLWDQGIGCSLHGETGC